MASPFFIEFWRSKMLNRALVDKLADYEDELKSSQPQSRPTSAVGIHRIQLQSRISHLLPSSTRRAISQPPPSDPATDPSPTTTPNTNNNTNNPHNDLHHAELLALLTREQSLRQAAESRVSATNEELEELSAQLFTEANEMVATERKARARLEERVAVLEGREREKGERLEVLEGRMGRIERVRGLLR